MTSHSPDLLDDEQIPDESILAVVAEDGETHIGPLDEAGRSVLRDHLYTAGELLRLDQLRPDIPRRRFARATRPDRAIRVVLAKAEFESWFLAAAATIAGHRGLPLPLVAPADPESIRDAKGWLSARMPAGRSYSETLDQPALTSLFDLAKARQARSFDKLWRDVTSML